MKVSGKHEVEDGGDGVKCVRLHPTWAAQLHGGGGGEGGILL